MILKNILTFVFLMTTLLVVSQNKVCESQNGNELVDLNTIGKCSIEEFKKSNDKEYVKIVTRNRYVRKKTNPYLTKLKKGLKATDTDVDTESKTRTIQVKTVENTKTEVVKDFVRFDKVTQMPVFLTCADFSYDHRENCKKETLVHYVLENLIYPFDAAAEGIEGRVWVRFIIDLEGYVKNITTKGPSNAKLLEAEAERLISLLPKFIPGKLNEDYVNVEYFIPIDFQLDE